MILLLCLLCGYITVTGHAACPYEKILSNDYILQSRSVSLYNIGLYFSAVKIKLIAIILLYFWQQ